MKHETIKAIKTIVVNQGSITTVQVFNKADEVFCTITADTQTGIITDVWKGFFGSVDNFGAAIREIIDLFKEGKGMYYKWFADLRQMEGEWKSEMNNMVGKYMPLALSNGLLFEAIVLPKNFFAKKATVETIDALGDKGVIRQFSIDQYDNALKWITSVKAEEADHVRKTLVKVK